MFAITPLDVRSSILIDEVYSIDEVVRSKLLERSRVGRFAKRHNVWRCVKCGLKAVMFIRHRHENETIDQSHVDLFGINDTSIRMFTIDHILPGFWGGASSQANYQLACQPCNNGKRTNVSDEEWATIIANPSRYVGAKKKQWKMFDHLITRRIYGEKQLDIMC